jgi:uncharacterized protein (TIGR02270 family)
MAPFRDLVDESFDEAVFLWRRWEGELSSPTRNLLEVWSWTEDRLHGALDGVRVDSEVAIDLATQALSSDDSDRLTVAAALLASCRDHTATGMVAAALNAANGRTLATLLRALELVGSNQALRAASSVLIETPAGAGALCRLKTFLRAPPGDEMTVAFQSGVPEAQTAAMRAARIAAPGVREKWITAGMESEDVNVRYAALESGQCLGMDRARTTATRLASQLDSSAGPYLKLLAMLGAVEEQETIYAALRVPDLQAAAIWALGHIGTVRAVEACLAGMRHENLARASGEAYSWITGADLVRDGLAAKEARVDAPPFEQDDLDANLVPPPEALWPLPDVEAVRRHWSGQRTAFTESVRHVHGQPVTTETLMRMVESGPMLRRPDLVFELRVKTLGKYDVEPRAFSARQRQMMASSRAAIVSHDER